MSAMATSLTFESALRVFLAAPVPRPPQPTRPTLSRLLWPANRLGARARPPATAEAVRKSRRVAGVSVMGGGSGVGCGRGPRGHMTYRSYGTYRSYRPGGNNLHHPVLRPGVAAAGEQL